MSHSQQNLTSPPSSWHLKYLKEWTRKLERKWAVTHPPSLRWLEGVGKLPIDTLPTLAFWKNLLYLLTLSPQTLGSICYSGTRNTALISGDQSCLGLPTVCRMLVMQSILSSMGPLNHHPTYSRSCSRFMGCFQTDCLKAEQDLIDLKMTRRLMQEDQEPRRPKWIQY